MPDEQRLLARLLGNYERSVRPVFNASHTVLIHFGLTLIHILDMVSGDNGLVIRQAVSGCCVSRRRSAAAWCLSLLLRLPFLRMWFGSPNCRFLSEVRLAFVFVVVIVVVVVIAFIHCTRCCFNICREMLSLHRSPIQLRPLVFAVYESATKIVQTRIVILSSSQ